MVTTPELFPAAGQLLTSSPPARDLTRDITLIAIMLGTSMVAFAARPSAQGVETLDPRIEASQILRDVNDARAAQNLAPLAMEDRLGRAAQAFAQYMAQHERYGHDADGRNPEQRAQAAGYGFCIVAENIAYRGRAPPFRRSELAATLVSGWRNSPPHLHNILDGNVADTGIGLAQGASGRWYAVQMFGRPESARIVFDVTNETGVTISYRLDGEPFELRPRSTRTHEDCVPRKLAVRAKDRVTQVDATPGGHYRIIVDAADTFRMVGP